MPAVSYTTSWDTIYYMLLADFRDYIETQERVDATYKDPSGWDRKAIVNVARAAEVLIGPERYKSTPLRFGAFSPARLPHPIAKPGLD
jgi:glucan phosphorylase